MDQVSVVAVVGAAAVLLQLIVLYFPGLNAWFAGLEGQVKQLVFLGLDFLVAALWVAFLAAQCLNLPGLVCPSYDPALAVQVFIALGGAFVVAVTSQQAAYLAAPKPLAVLVARAER